jgi:uncharacterized protein (DUF2141 family)
VVAPGGGPRDDKAPQVVKYIPDSAQLNFNSKLIGITFNEYIQLKDLNSQLIISPPLEKSPEIEIRNKTLFIDLNDQQLKPNTTYSISFGNALQDLNESNPKENFSYIFSTGSYIDSLKIKGKVENAFDQKTEKGVLVMLYTDMDDSAIYKKLPAYFAKTAADGSFVINNIRQGKYKIAALKDLNMNYKYDGDAESIGFLDKLVEPETDSSVSLRLFPEAPKKIFLKKYSHPSYGKVVLVFNQGSDSIRINNISNDKKGVQEFIEFSKNKDTLNYWAKNYDKDSLKLQVSNGNYIIDTVEFKTIKLDDALKSKRNPLRLLVMTSPKGSQSFDLGSEFKLTFNNPIADNSGGAFLKEDTLRSNRAVPVLSGQTELKLMYWDSSTYESIEQNAIGFQVKSGMIPFKEWKENTNYKLYIPPGTFTDIFNQKNDTIQIDFKTREMKYYGSLKLNLVYEESNKNAQTVKETINPSPVLKSQEQYILQLLNDKETIVREDIIKGSEIIHYEYLPPNKYKIKLIFDENGNGKWDSGDFLKKIQPENVLYNIEPINIRSNWDAEIEWKITN